MKYEWRKKDKKIYLPKDEPTIIDLEPMNYVTITGSGNPNSEAFGVCVSALYQLSYGIRMSYKGEDRIDGYYEYTVFPLEGIWNLSDKGKDLYKQGVPVKELKDYLEYKVMIRQPEFVTHDVFNKFKELVYKSKKNDKVLDLQFETIDEGKVCQMMHIGSYDDEVASFNKMEEYCESQGFTRSNKEHKEIYLTDPSKVSPEKLKTTIRFGIQ